MIAAAERQRLAALVADLNAVMPPHIMERVVALSDMMATGDVSPIDCSRILAGTVQSLAEGLGGSIDEGLDLQTIFDIENLSHTVSMLRSAADVLEAILKRAAQ